MFRKVTSITPLDVVNWSQNQFKNPILLSTTDKALISNIKKFNSDSSEYKAELSIIEKSLICPVSKKILKNPVIALCGHTFSKASTEGLVICPVDNCGKELTLRPVRVLNDFLEYLALDANENNVDPAEINLLESYKKIVNDDKIRGVRDILTCPVTQCVFFSAVMLTECGHAIESDAVGTIASFSQEPPKCPTCRIEFKVSNAMHLPLISLITRSLAHFNRAILDDQYFTVDLLIRVFMEKDLLSLKFIIQCFYEKPDLFNHISQSMLSYSTSPLFIFGFSHLGMVLLENNENLIDLITAEAFNYKINDNGIFHGVSPLSQFCNIGRAVLRKNKKLLNKIEASTFYHVDGTGLTPCNLLIANDAIDIFAEEQRLIGDMTTERLNIPNTQQPLKGITLLFLLSLKEEGIKLLLKYPQIVKNISSAALCNPLQIEGPYNPGYAVSVLTQIAVSRGEGFQLLAMHDDLRAKITCESFRFIAPTGGNKGVSLFSYFACAPEGINILKKDKRLRSFINEDLLNSRFVTGSPVLINFFSQDEGIELFEIDPTLCDKISAYEFNFVYENSEMEFKVSPVCLILGNQKGCELLRKNPELCSKISTESLLTVFNVEVGFPLLELVLKDHGLQLLKASPIFRSKLTAAGLLTKFNLKNGAISPLDVLLSKLEGQKVIQLLKMKNPDLYAEINALAPQQLRVKIALINFSFSSAEANTKLEQEINDLEVLTKHDVNAVLLNKILSRYNLPDASSANLHKALRRAAAKNNPEDIIFLVNENGCYINTQDDNPGSLKTAMHWAVINKSYQAVQALMTAGARIDINDFEGRTARSLAVEMNDAEISKLLALSPSAILDEVLRSFRI